MLVVVVVGVPDWPWSLVCPYCSFISLSDERERERDLSEERERESERHSSLATTNLRYNII